MTDYEEYTEIAREAQKWLDETDTMQFSTMELLTMFSASKDDQIKKLKKELGIYKEMIDRIKSALDKRLPAKEVIQETETIKPEKR
jgi:hypothetical protein